ENIVLFPHTVLPLLVYEPNYVNLVLECAEKDKLMAIGLGAAEYDHQGVLQSRYLRPYDVMTLAKPYIVQRYKDNSLYVVMKGESKIYLDRVTQYIPFILSDAALVNSRDHCHLSLEERKIHDPYILQLQNLLSSWISRQVENDLHKNKLLGEIATPDAIINYSSFLMVEDTSVKQLILESNDILEQLRFLKAVIRPYPVARRPYQFNFTNGSAIKKFIDIERDYRAVQ
ncbi:MAG: LON peptidase substrate-binding domain-containing protein, partial [Bacteriovoracia bacterium]